MARKDELIVGLDIGTTKICCIVGEFTDEGLDIIGLGVSPSGGLRKGVVINIDSTVQSIVKAVEEAELMAGCEITNVFCGITGGHIKGINSRGTVAIKDREVREADVARVIENAKAISIPLDREVIHVLPQEYMVDDQDGIKDPLGMCGVRLEAKVHIVTGAVNIAENIVKCVNSAGLNVADIVLQPLASSLAVLGDDEKQLGVALVDIGGGTTDISIYSQGSIVHTGVLTLGGNQITQDIAVGLRTPYNEAEEIKHRYGIAMVSMVERDAVMEVQSVGGRRPRVLPRQVIAEIIEPRVEEIFELVHGEIQKSGYEDLLASGIVITGGSAILEGMPDLAEEVLGHPVRRGQPLNICGLSDVVKSPMYSTGVGLVLFGARNGSGRNIIHCRGRESSSPSSRFIKRMKDWFADMF